MIPRDNLRAVLAAFTSLDLRQFHHFGKFVFLVFSLRIFEFLIFKYVIFKLIMVEITSANTLGVLSI